MSGKFQSKVSSDHKSFYNFIKNESNKYFSSLISFENIKVSNRQDIVDVFALFFKLVYKILVVFKPLSKRQVSEMIFLCIQLNYIKKIPSSIIDNVTKNFKISRIIKIPCILYPAIKNLSQSQSTIVLAISTRLKQFCHQHYDNFISNKS